MKQPKWPREAGKGSVADVPGQDEFYAPLVLSEGIASAYYREFAVYKDPEKDTQPLGWIDYQGEVRYADGITDLERVVVDQYVFAHRILKLPYRELKIALLEARVNELTATVEQLEARKAELEANPKLRMYDLEEKGV